MKVIICKLEELKEYISIAEGISLSSEIYLSEESLKAIKTKKIKLTLKRLTAQGDIFQLTTIKLFAKSGNFIFRYWNDTSSIEIDEEVTGNYDIYLSDYSYVKIGKSTTSNGIKMILIKSGIHIGEDCMFSDGVLLQSTDQHGIVDIKNKRIINDFKREIVIKNHVWLARNTTIMPGITIGEGSVVGLGSIVTKNVPETSIVAGNPAKVVKKNMTWTRYSNRFDNYVQQEFLSL